MLEKGFKASLLEIKDQRLFQEFISQFTPDYDL